METIWREKTKDGYKWPRTNVQDDVKYVLAGRLAEVPQKRSKVVRVFISSTFTDTYVERNTLMQKTFPRLKLYCQDEHALDFQVVDMRWGVQDEASDDHSAAELCMRELKTCHRLSVGPTFVTLIGQRYGSRPIPVRIPEKELNLILKALEGHGETEDIPSLKKWFRLDDNAVPAEYILQSLTTIGKNSMTDEQRKELFENNHWEDVEELNINTATLSNIDGNKETEDKVKVIWQAWLDNGRKLWREAEPRLAASLRTGATHCIREGSLTKEDAHVFTRSVTDEEIENGILRDAKRNSTSLCFMRTIKDINLKHPKAHRFIDQLSDGSLDEEAQGLLNVLKMEKIPKCLSKSNIFHFETTWSDNEGVNEEDHGDYIAEFCDTLEKELKNKIEAGLKNSTKVTDDLLYDEVLEHAHQALAKCERFHGRLDILDEIKNYIMSDNRKPLVIHGESGCGKTSIMAKASLMMPEWLGDNADLHIILRFLGTTPLSSTISNTMLSVTTQIHRTVMSAGQDLDLPQNFIDIKDFFISTLDNLQTNELKNKRVVLVLDSLDQLSAIHGAHALGWLPTELPSNVKLIVSTLPAEHKILDTLRCLNLGDGQFIPVNALNKEDCLSILDLWLTQLSRKITKEQQTLVDQVISKSDIRPLYLKLLFDEILMWRSFQTPEEVTTLQPNIEKSILQLFTRLERKHGAKLVQRAFGYLTASKNGLTELEMEDLLSLDDEVLDSVFEFHLPPIRRLPSILWARIRGDISEYIVDREADGARVMAWYHRQFIEKASRYFYKADNWGSREDRHPSVTNEDDAAIARNIYEYFLGKYTNGRKKTFKYTEKQMKKYNFDSSHTEAERYVAQQPSIFRKLDGSIDLENVRFNNRKVSELPTAIDHFLSFSTEDPDNILQVESIMATLFNWEFLTAWCACATWAEIADALEGKESSPVENLSKSVKLLRSVFLLCITTIYNNPYTLGPQIAGRMLPYIGTMEAFSHLIDGIEKEGRLACALVAPHYNLETPGGAMLYVVTNHSSAVRDSQMFGMGLVSVSDKLVYVSMEQGEVVTDIRPRTMPHGDNFSVLALARDKSVSPGNEYEKGEPIACASLQHRPWVYIMECSTGQVRETVRIEEVTTENFPHVSGLLVLGNYLIASCSLSSTILIFNSMDGSQIGRIKGSEMVTDIKITAFNDHVYLMVLRTSEDMVVEFYKIGKSRLMGDSSDDEYFMELLEVDTSEISEDEEESASNKAYSRTTQAKGENQTTWYKNAPHRVHMGKRQLSTFAVADSYIFAPFAFADGTITYFLSLPDEDFESDTEQRKSESEASQSDEEMQNSSYDSDDFFSTARRQDNRILKMLPKKYKKFKKIPEIGAKMHTVNTDYYPVHNISCLRSSVHEEMLLTVCCTAHMLVVYEMVEGTPIMRVRKHYTGARVSGRCGILIACSGGDIDIFRLSLWKPVGLVHYASIDAHSRPIQKLGILGEDFMFYSTSNDGSLKFWNTDKLKETAIPKFDRAKDVIELACYAGSKPHEMVAVTYYPPTPEKQTRSIDVWHVISGRRRETIQSPKPVLAAVTYTKSSLEFDLLTLVSNGDLHIWNISDLFDDKLETRNKRLPGKKTLLENCSEDVKAAMICNSKSGMLYIVLSTGQFLTYELKNQTVLYKSADLGNDIKCPHIDNDGNFACFVGPEWQLHVRNAHGKVIGVENTGFENEIVGVSNKGSRYLLKSSNTAVKIFDPETRNTILKKDVARHGELWKITTAAISPDGNYILIACDRDLKMVRTKDGRLIAWVTLYDTICSINVTPDSWFVILGMPDRRFYVLLISDPENTEHDQRVNVARKNNSFDEEKTKALTDIALKDNSSSDDSDADPSLNYVTLLDMENEGRAKRSLSRSGRTRSKMTSRMTTHSDDSSDEEGGAERRSQEALIVLTPQLCSLQ